MTRSWSHSYGNFCTRNPKLDLYDHLRYTTGQILIVHRCLYINEDSTARIKILDGQNVTTSPLESHFLNVLRPNSGTNLVDAWYSIKTLSLQMQYG
jgi:hypothetical protein